MPSHADLTLRDLLGDTRWMNSIARSLASNATDAEDLAQEAAVAALQSPPPRPVNAKGWLQTVMRNALRQRQRGDARRVKREATLSSRPLEQPESPDRIVERTILRKQVAEAALALAEPYRTPILMRYFDGMKPNQISDKLQTPLPTVHTQLRRGLEMLRQRLDRVVGPNQDWRALLIAAPKLSILSKLVLTTALALPVGVAVNVVNAEQQPANTEAALANPLAPTGDADLDELRYLSLKAPIDELVERWLFFAYAFGKSYREDRHLARGLERLIDYALQNEGMQEHRAFCASLCQVIEYGEPWLRARLGYRLPQMRRFR